MKIQCQKIIKIPIFWKLKFFLNLEKKINDFFLFRLISYSKWKHVNTETQRVFTYSIEEKAWFTMSPILLQSINGVCFSLQVYHTIQDRKLSPIKMFLFLINIKIIKTFLSQFKLTIQILNFTKIISFYQQNYQTALSV